MNNLFVLIILLLLSKVTFSQDLKKPNFEIGCRIVTFENYNQRNYDGGEFVTLRVGVKSTFKYEQELPTQEKNYFFQEKKIKTTGVYIPGLFVRYRVFKNFWVRGSLEYFSMTSKSTSSFYIPMQGDTAFYSQYNVSTKGYNIDYSIQYQWFNRRYVTIYGALESKYCRLKINENSEGYIGYSIIQYPFVKGERKEKSNISIPNVVNSVSFKVYDGFYFSYETMFTLDESKLQHRFSASVAF